VKHIPAEDLLDVVGCDIQARPDAPGLDELAANAGAATRTTDALTIAFPAEHRGTVEAFAAAERVCCSGIGWAVEGTGVVVLRITANETALDALEAIIQRYIEKAR